MIQLSNFRGKGGGGRRGGGLSGRGFGGRGRGSSYRGGFSSRGKGPNSRGNFSSRSAAYAYNGRNAPTRSANSSGRGPQRTASGRYVNRYGMTGNQRGPGWSFQPGSYVNAGRDRGTRFVPYTARPSQNIARGGGGAASSTPAPTPDPTPTDPPEDPRYPPDGPQPRPPADTISPGPRPDGGGRALRIRESPARRTAFTRGERARGSRRSARVAGIRSRRSSNRLARSVSGLGKASRSRLGINV